MFKNSKRGEHSFSKFSSSDSVSKKTNKLKDEDSELTNSKNSRKNVLNILRQKIFGKKRRDLVAIQRSSKSFKSKSFEVLSNSFEETEHQEQTLVGDDSVTDKSKWSVKHSQSMRTKETVCPTDCTNHLEAKSRYQHSDHTENEIITYSCEEKEIETRLNSSNSSINNPKLPLRTFELNCNVDSEHGESSSQSCGKQESPICSEEVTPTQNVLQVNTVEDVTRLLQTQVALLPSTSSQSKDIKNINLTDLGLHSTPYFEIKDGESRSLVKEIKELSRNGWYWGPLNRSEAEEKLCDQPDGAFFVRDSSDVKYLLSLSFRSYGKTLHTRIEHSNGCFSFYPQPDHESHRSLVGLINHCISESDGGVFCYSRPLAKGSPSFPVRLTTPVSRFMQVRSLQYLCRFVIRQDTSINHIQTLPLPPKIKGYLEESYY